MGNMEITSRAQPSNYAEAFWLITINLKCSNLLEMQRLSLNLKKKFGFPSNFFLENA